MLGVIIEQMGLENTQVASILNCGLNNLKNNFVIGYDFKGS